MRKFTLLLLMLFGAVSFAQQTTLKGNGVSNPIHYNQQQKTKSVVIPEGQQNAETEIKNLGENKPNFQKKRQNKSNAAASKGQQAVDAQMEKLGDNNPVFYKNQQNNTKAEGNRSGDPTQSATYQGDSAPQSKGGENKVSSLEKSIFGSSGFSTSGIQGKTMDNPAAGTASAQLMGYRPEAPVVITHSLSQSIVANNSVTCNAGGIPKENSFFRDFNLAADFGITAAFNVTSAEFAVEAVTGATNLTLNVYSTTTVFPGGYPGSATLQGTASYTSTAADANKVISVPLTATIPAGAIMIYELKINAGATFSWFPGSNAAGQTGKSWIMSADCSISVPTDLTGMGFPNQHMVMNIVGEEGGGGGGSFPAPYCGPLEYNSDVEPITLVEVAAISNRSSAVINGSPAHEDFTAIIGNMEEGESYSIALEGNTSGGFTCSFVVFIDWNQDGILDNASERYEIGTINNSTGEDGKQATGTITVPAGVTPGPTRMRVMKRFGSTYAPDSCTGGSGYGQAEDYTISVTAGGGGGGGTCATPILEVNQDEDNSCMANISQGGLAQSYIAQEPNAAGAGIKFRDPSTGLDVDLSLWDGLPNAGGTMLASGTSQTDGTNWADVLWDPVVSVTVGNTYYIVIDGDTALPCLSGALNNPYPGGMVHANNYGPFPDYDYTFRTYSCDSGGGGGTTCSQDNPENGFENGYTTSSDQGQRIAFDITVPVDTDFTLNTATVNIWMNPGATLTSSDITFYSDAGGAPGAFIKTQAAVIPTSQSVIGNNFGFDISEVIFNITPEMLAGQAGVETTYWVVFGVTVSAGSGYISSTTASIEGYEAYFSSDGVTWNVISGNDIVYNFEGVCEAIGGGGTGGPCSESAPSNAFENGKSFTKNLGRIVAADITIAADDDMMLETINLTAFIGSVGSGVNASNVDVFIYADSGTGSPGALLTSQVGLVPASQTVIGNNFGYDAWSVDLDIADFNLPGQAGVTTTYWIGLSLEPTDGSNTFWEYSSAAVVGYGLGYNDGSGYVMEPTNEVVYTFAGTCTATGGGGTGGPCSITGPSNNMEDGKSFTKNIGRIVANDITVAADDNMMLETINISAFIGSAGSGVNASNVDVFIYADSGTGSPGALLTSQLSLVPAAQTVIGSNFGFDLWSVDLDIADFNLPGQAGVATTYWVGLSLEPTDGSNTFWEFSSAGVIGYGMGYNDGSGFVMEPTNEGVYTFAGTCTSSGGPSNDNCSGAIALSCGDSVSGDTSIATDSGGNPAPDVYYKYTGSGTAQMVTISLCGGGTNYDSVLRVFDNCDLSNEIAFNDDFCGLQSELAFESNGTSTYYIMVEGSGSASGNFGLDITCVNLSVGDNQLEGFSFYPNPTNGVLNLNSSNSIEMVTIYNLLGQTVLTQKVGATNATLDISGMSVGTYIMRATVNGQVGVYKIVKK